MIDWSGSFDTRMGLSVIWYELLEFAPAIVPVQSIGEIAGMVERPIRAVKVAGVGRPEA